MGLQIKLIAGGKDELELSPQVALTTNMSASGNVAVVPSYIEPRPKKLGVALNQAHSTIIIPKKGVH
jgi:hypothetical protein